MTKSNLERRLVALERPNGGKRRAIILDVPLEDCPVRADGTLEVPPFTDMTPEEWDAKYCGGGEDPG